jgi:hypothetical protein
MVCAVQEDPLLVVVKKASVSPVSPRPKQIELEGHEVAEIRMGVGG